MYTESSAGGRLHTKCRKRSRVWERNLALALLESRIFMWLQAPPVLLGSEACCQQLSLQSSTVLSQDQALLPGAGFSPVTRNTDSLVLYSSQSWRTHVEISRITLAGMYGTEVVGQAQLLWLLVWTQHKSVCIASLALAYCSQQLWSQKKFLAIPDHQG